MDQNEFKRIMKEKNLITKIRYKKITYNIGDKVLLFRKKSNKHPLILEYGIEYTIKYIECNKLVINLAESKRSLTFVNNYKVDNSFVLPISVYRSINRDEKIEELLS